MRRTIRNLSMLTVLVFLVGSAAAGAPASPPAIKEDTKGIVLSNDRVSFSFQDKKPTLSVRAAGASSDAFVYTFDQVVEYRDMDADGAPSDSEIVARLDLTNASYQVNQSTNATAAVLNLSLSAPVKLAKPPTQAPPGVLDNVTLPNSEAQLTLLFTLRGAESTLTSGAANLAVPASAVKYDFIVTKWPFLDASTNRLALDMHVSGAASRTVGVGVDTAALLVNGTQVGAVSWSTLAKGATASGAALDVPVKATLKPLGGGSGASNATRIVYTYDAAGVSTLVHDPTIGLAAANVVPLPSSTGIVGAGKPTPGAGFVAALGVLATVALAARKRR